ncbi:MAG: hypothetical protein LKG11_00645 [Bacilli bacterium]|nr:hypothetical protein [Bacilli bacterium]
MDFTVITEKESPVRFTSDRLFFLKGLKVECSIYSLKEYKEPWSYTPNILFCEEEGHRLVFGTCARVPAHACKRKSEEAIRAIELFENGLFFPQDDELAFPKKRLASFLMLARSFGEKVSDDEIEDAHDEKKEPSEYKDMFFRVKKAIEE